jgi:CRISPR/Cas system-associated endonuclease Cas1
MSNGRVKRENNTLVIEQQSTGLKRPIPVEDVESLYVFGEVDLNSKVLNFLSQKRIALHLFNYYGHYSGTFHPREYLHSGFLLVKQAAHYSNQVQRTTLARETVQASAHSILRTLGYYVRRKGGAEAAEPVGEIAPTYEPMNAAAEVDFSEQESEIDATVKAGSLALDLEPESTTADAGYDPIAGLPRELHEEPARESLAGIYASIGSLAGQLAGADRVDVLRGLEGKMRERYYSAWGDILIDGWRLDRRVRRPPDNELNALISFGNSWLYTICLGEIYRTQLTPTIAYLHEPGDRRFSLALDLSELFKPLIVDRVIFKLVNTRQIDTSHFDKTMDGCLMNDAGKTMFLKELESKLATTIKHRRLGRSVSYRQLIRLECYKLVRHLTGLDKYKAFRAWW